MQAADPVARLDLRRQQLVRERGREQRVVGSRVRTLDPDREPREVARRRPEAGGRELRIGVPPPLDRAPDLVVRGSGSTVKLLGQGLGVVAVAHPERLQHQLAHELAERRPGDVLEQLLHDHRPTAGVAELEPGNGVDPHGERVRRPDAVEHLDRRRQRVARAVAREARRGQAGAVADELAQRDDRLPAFERRDPPRREPVVDVLVEIEDTAVDEPQHREGGDRLADRAGLEERRRRDRIAAIGGHQAEAALVHDLAALDQRPRRAGHGELARDLPRSRPRAR